MLSLLNNFIMSCIEVGFFLILYYCLFGLDGVVFVDIFEEGFVILLFGMGELLLVIEMWLIGLEEGMCILFELVLGEVFGECNDDLL